MGCLHLTWRISNVVIFIAALSLILISLITNCWITTEFIDYGLWELCYNVNRTCERFAIDMFVPIVVVRASIITAAASCLIALCLAFYVIMHPRSKCGVTIMGSAAVLTGLCCLLGWSSWIDEERLGCYGFSFYCSVVAMGLVLVSGAFIVCAPWKCLLEEKLQMDSIAPQHDITYVSRFKSDSSEENNNVDCVDAENAKSPTSEAGDEESPCPPDTPKSAWSSPYRNNVVYSLARHISMKLRQVKDDRERKKEEKGKNKAEKEKNKEEENEEGEEKTEKEKKKDAKKAKKRAKADNVVIGLPPTGRKMNPTFIDSTRSQQDPTGVEEEEEEEEEEEGTKEGDGAAKGTGTPKADDGKKPTLATAKMVSIDLEDSTECKDK